MLGKLPAEAFSGDSVWIPFRVSVRVARSKVRTAKRLAHAGSKSRRAIAGESSASYAPQLGLLVSQPSRPWIVLGIEGGGDRDRKSHLFHTMLGSGYPVSGPHLARSFVTSRFRGVPVRALRGGVADARLRGAGGRIDTVTASACAASACDGLVDPTPYVRPPLCPPAIRSWAGCGSSALRPRRPSPRSSHASARGLLEACESIAFDVWCTRWYHHGVAQRSGKLSFAGSDRF